MAYSLPAGEPAFFTRGSRRFHARRGSTNLARVPRQRTVDDSWYTALYLDPRIHWWAPGLIVACILLAMLFLLLDEPLLESATVATGMGLASALGTYLRRRLNRRRS